MHPSAYKHMQLCVDRYLRKDRHYRVVDVGARVVDPNHPTHRPIFDGYDVDYVGVDINAGHNVDRVMKKPYTLPLKANSVDLVISGQCFEHIPFPWATMLDINRILKPGGLVFLTAPSRGHRHGVQDAWRYYTDGMRALAAYARMNVAEVYTDHAPRGGNGRSNYRAIDLKNRYWGDTVAVFRKPKTSSRLVRLVGPMVVWWANRVGGIDHVASVRADPKRERAAG